MEWWLEITNERIPNRGRRKRKQQKRLCFSEYLQQGKNSLPFLRVLFISRCTCCFAKGKGAPCEQSFPLSWGGTYWLNLGARESTISPVLKPLLWSCFLWGSLVSPSFCSSPALTVLFKPAPQGACSSLQRDCFPGGLLVVCLFHRSCSGACLRDSRGHPQLHLLCDAHFTYTSHLLCISPQRCSDKAYLQPSALPSILFFLLTHPSSYHRPWWEIKKHCISCPFLYAKSSLQVGLCSLGQAPEPHPAVGADPASGSVSCLSGASREVLSPSWSLDRSAESSCLRSPSLALRLPCVHAGPGGAPHSASWRQSSAMATRVPHPQLMGPCAVTLKSSTS